MSKSINWFKLNRSLHRDIGYFCIGMTLIFAISGIAVNHVEDWNPNYEVTQQRYKIDGLATQIDRDNFKPWLLEQLHIEADVKAQFWESPQRLKLFTKQDHTIVVSTADNSVLVEQVKPRVVLRSFNFLHLNEARQAWTYFSDAYAVMLIFLSLSALFMVKGRYGAFGKRGWLVVAGIAVPLTFILVYS